MLLSVPHPYLNGNMTSCAPPVGAGVSVSCLPPAASENNNVLSSNSYICEVKVRIVCFLCTHRKDLFFLHHFHGLEEREKPDLYWRKKGAMETGTFRASPGLKRISSSYLWVALATASAVRPEEASTTRGLPT